MKQPMIHVADLIVFWMRLRRLYLEEVGANGASNLLRNDLRISGPLIVTLCRQRVRRPLSFRMVEANRLQVQLHRIRRHCKSDRSLER